jgi:para-aminobenzoate synthetase component 1
VTHAENAPIFWMGGRLATDLVAVSHDAADLDDGGFWAISTDFEGGFIGAKFATVIDSDFPAAIWTQLQGSWISNFSREQYCSYVEGIRESIAQGWVYQVNACRILSIENSSENLRGLFSEILAKNPAPWASYLEIPGLNIASASPELFLKRAGSIVKTSPIKGTQQLTENGFGNKDTAENIMIVDLMRNDFGQICESGTVEVPRLLANEDHPGLRHLVSDVQGQVRDELTWKEILESLSPPGSISGAPKSSAVSVIRENESARGPYCGALGWIHGKDAELSVAIRIFWQEGKLHFGTGAGITWNSDPQQEWEETQLKARNLISIAGGVLN